MTLQRMVRSTGLACGVLALAVMTTASIRSARRTRVGASCEALASMRLEHGSIVAARVVGAGSFAPNGGAAAPAYGSLPAFCRIVARLSPTPASDIEIEVWAPIANWNGKLAAVGNGAFSGSIPHAALAGMLAKGYAVGAANTGP